MKRLATLATLGILATLGFPSTAMATCAEDRPCWNWAKMGDGNRGVTLTSGRHVVVGCERFARLDRRDRIDWATTPRFKGDRTARKRCA